MNLAYASEKLGEAIRELVIGEGDAKSRLNASAPSLACVPAGVLPGDLKAEFESIWGDLMRHESPYKGKSYDIGTVAYTVSRMQNRTASKIAGRIYSLNAKVEQLLYKPR